MIDDYRPMEVAKVAIKAVGGIGGTTVEINGEHVPCVRVISFCHEAGQLPRLEIEVLPNEVSIEGDAQVARVVRCPDCRNVVKQKTCDNCLHWQGLNQDGWRTWGLCTFEHQKMLAFIPDVAPNGAAPLRTASDFGCVHFEARQ